MILKVVENPLLEIIARRLAGNTQSERIIVYDYAG